MQSPCGRKRHKEGVEVKGSQCDGNPGKVANVGGMRNQTGQALLRSLP